MAIQKLVAASKIDDSESVRVGRRHLLRAAAAGMVTAAAGASAQASPASGSGGVKAPLRVGIRAIKLYTGPDHLSHVLEGTIDEADRTDVIAIYFKETPAHAANDWHDSPESQFVITLSGTLVFTTRDGETFVLHPGDVLLSEDTAATGHKWRLIDDQPWRRAYVVLKPGAKDSFVAHGWNSARGDSPLEGVCRDQPTACRSRIGRP